MTYVSNLINENVGWDVDWINEFCHLNDVELVKSIPLLRTRIPDKIIWHYEKDYCYLVRNGCHLASNEVGEAEDSGNQQTKK